MSGGFKFYHKPPTPQSPNVLARKCIVCGTTKSEDSMKPFLLKGDHLNLWTNNYFHNKSNKIFGFFAKIRYTINPFACIDHFKSLPAILAASTAARNNKRMAQELVAFGEEPPSIQSITQKKPSPPPEEQKTRLSEKEINDAVMAILVRARAEMDKEDENMKQLIRITHKVMHGDDVEDGEMSVVRKKKRKRVRGEKKKKEKPPNVDGNEADSDNSDAVVDVEAIDSSSDEWTTDSGEASDIEVGTAAASTMRASSVRRPFPSTPAARPYPSQFFPQGIRPVRPYVIGQPRNNHLPPLGARPVGTQSYSTRPVGAQSYSTRPVGAQSYSTRPVGAQSYSTRPVDTRPHRVTYCSATRQPIAARPPLSLNVPKRLTLTTGMTYDRPSWVAPNPGQHTLASVLQRFWNEDAPADPLLSPPPMELMEKIPRPPPPPPFGRTMIPGTKTRFMPASIALPSLPPATSTPSTGHHPLIRKSALLQHPPPLSPSRLIIASEETVETTRDSDEEKESTVVLSSSSSSSSCSEESDVEVCDDHSGERPPVEGQRIEGEVETKSGGDRSRTLSTMTVFSSGMESVTSSGEEEELEVDVETLDVASERDTVAPPTLTAVHDSTVTAADHKEERKRVHSGTIGGQLVYYRKESKNRIILQPSAVVKPPTKLLSTAQLSMKDLLKAQARAASMQRVSINTRGLLGAAMRRARAKDMPRLSEQARRERKSEWSRLKKVVESKLAEQKAQIVEERKKEQKNMIDPQLMADSPPPVLDRVEGIEEGFHTALLDSLTEGKVLRLRIHKKDKKEEEEVDVSKMKVMDRSTRPQGVGRMEEVDACSSSSAVVDAADGDDDLPLIEKEGAEKRDERKAGHQVTHPQLIISKKDIMELREKLDAAAPPPTPVVGIPAKEEFAARREMYEKKRHATVVRAGLRFGRLKIAKETWTREKLMKMNGLGEKVERRGKMEYEEDGEDDDEQEEEALVAEMVEIVKRVKAEKAKNRGEEKVKKMMTRRRKGMDVDENEILMMSDIDNDNNEEDEREGEADREMKRVERKDEEEEEESENDGQPRRKSHRLQLKRKAMPKSERRLIWKTSDDDEDEEPSVFPEPPAKRKRGRPRKNPLDYYPPPMQKKRVSKKSMTAMEKEVLSRVFPSLSEDDEDVEMDDLREEEKMEKRRGSGDKTNVATEDTGSDAVQESDVEKERPDKKGKKQKKKESENQHPEAVRDGPVLTAKRRKMTWSWKQKLGDGVHEEMGGRLCNYCMKHQKRYVWIPNLPVALMDHARTHCVETLMCPNRECTYMSTQRSRLAQHVSYVHKKWGMPIDLAEMYPSMRKSLMMRLRHCFPELSTASVCNLCRVAVRRHPSHHRWHAQTHLKTHVYECSRDICTAKFTSEEDFLEHAKKTKCHGSIVNGMTDEMEEELAELVEQCFKKECQQPKKQPVRAELVDGEVHSDTPSTSNAKSSSQEIENEEKEEEAVTSQ